MFEWETPPSIWVDGIEDYATDTFAELFALCEKHAALMQAYLRENAPWEDSCMPGREYLFAKAFYPDQWSVGILVGYDLEVYRAKCGEPPFDWGARHELVTFAKKGVISVVVPKGELEGQVGATALGSLADDLWDEVRALYASGGVAS